ncbi:DUF2480 family protein [Fulvivirga lutea]|uniref:DUF2480 family protein n=1 Tax=Fulvivirga lutea TaxID=2810512 RepID=A0A975A155_9BACT|nr:DUF2480 family protein [Fulvivirga lutea]QSE97941.1 DUF2480 family protein [Fulvivirga lutea]
MQEEIVNRVANSGLITFNLEDYFDTSESKLLDLKDWLFQEMILKEKEFRQFVKEHDWSQYKDKNVAVHCSADAIIPTWAYMLVTIALEPYAKNIVLGGEKDLSIYLFNQALRQVNINDFVDARVVVKGCSKYPVPNNAYVEITKLLRPVASSIMYGEPCSTVPLYKKPKK